MTTFARTTVVTANALASDIVSRAFRRHQATDINDPAPSNSEMSAGLDVLGEVVNGWGSYGIPTETQTLTGDTVTDSDKVKNLASTATVMVGLNVSGAGIPASTTVKGVITDTQFQLSANATADGSSVSLSLAFLPLHVKYEGALVAILAVRLSEDVGLGVSAKLQMDADAGWNALLAGYIPDRKAIFDRAIARPAGVWNANTDWVP